MEQYCNGAFVQSDNDSDENDVVNMISVHEEENEEAILMRKHDKPKLKMHDSKKDILTVGNKSESNCQNSGSESMIENVARTVRSIPQPRPRKSRANILELHDISSHERKGKIIHSKSFTPNVNEIQEVTATLESSIGTNIDISVDSLKSMQQHTIEEEEVVATKPVLVKQEKRPLPRPRMNTNVGELISNDERNEIVTHHKQKESIYNNDIINYENEITTDNDQKTKKTSGIKKARQPGKNVHQSNNDEITEDPKYETCERKQQEVHNEHQEGSPKIGSSDESQLKNIIGILIHRSDCLQADMLIQHPIVKVYFFDTNTGKYLKKSRPDRPVSFYYENKDVDYILPLMTKSFDFKIKRSLVPTWEELLLFNEEMQYILSDDPPVLIMFEILDFVNFSIASSQYEKLGPDGGWHKIAWAFLKPLGANQHYNVEKKLRLQLYKPVFSSRPRSENCDVFTLWSQQIWERYPATLYVTVKGVAPPENILPALRSQIVLQQETASDALKFSGSGEAENFPENSPGTSNSKTCNTLIQSCPVWSRLPAQSCKVPNEIILSFPTSPKGCFLVKFSNSGLLLACTMANDDIFSIHLYTIPDGKEYASFLGHHGLIYDLSWSSSDSMLLSASADCTVCIWDVEKKRTNTLQMLPHPSFVYSAKFHGHRSWLLATGCNDHIVRMWVRQHKANQYDLVQELEGHQGFINSLCFIQQNSLFSADSVGSIFLWSCDKHSFSRKNLVPWERIREFSVRELGGIVINKLIVHPGGQRLLIHSRDNFLRMLDITTGIVIQWFRGAINHRFQTSSCVSPCGGLVFAASEDGVVYVWNADTGELIALYSGLNYHDTVTCIDYHPFDHMVAFSSYGSPSQVMVCVYNKLSSGTNVGLQLLNKEKLHQKSLDYEQVGKKDDDLSSKVQESFKSASKVNVVRMENNIEENPDNEESTSGFCNGTSDSSSYKWESSNNKSMSKKKIDLSYLINQMDEILSLKSHKNALSDSENIQSQK